MDFGKTQQIEIDLGSRDGSNPATAVPGWAATVFEEAKKRRATDICILEGKPVRMGILKEYTLLEEPLVKPSRQNLIDLIHRTSGIDLLKEDRGRFINEEYAFGVKNVGRFRVSATISEEGLGLAIRKLPYQIPSLKTLDKFDFLDGITRLLNFRFRPPSGLILHTGVTGCGKSTTIAAEIDYISQKISGNVLIFDNPIEYLITMRGDKVKHYEVGRHIESFLDGMKLALRNDPSVLMIGEVRTRQEIETLFEVASKGHLVFSTLHTSDIMNTLRFLYEVGDNKGSWRQMVANALRAIVSQKLLYRDGEFILLAEVLIPTPVIRNLIAKGDDKEILTALNTNQDLRENGSRPFSKSLELLTVQGLISNKEKDELLL